MPDSFFDTEHTPSSTYEVIEIGGNILLVPPPLDRERIALIKRLTKESIEDHRKTLEGLAR